jgi:NAD(P)-dependent dehydrogenase (short-subunit alcohol dehydrogenase family)
MTGSPHAAIASGRVAVITGGVSGIGLAAARRFAALGLKLVLADADGDKLKSAEADLGKATDVRTLHCDVADFDQLRALADLAYGSFGAVSVLMNNAGMGGFAAPPWAELDKWRRLVDVNLWGVIHGVQAFVPRMLEAGEPGLVINTGSKQGLTGPPGAYAYNLSKAGVRSFTEALSYELSRTEGAQLSAHLLIPGFTFTGLTRAAEKPAAAWTPDQVVDFMLAAIERGDFYILCPDNEVSREMDEKRLQWTADDIIKNRPALSRWRPEFAEAFARHVAD